MQINFLGTWSSNLQKGRRNVSLLVDGKFVFDFGPHSLETLLELNTDISEISIIYISHMHLDHYSGVPELLWYRVNNNIEFPLTIVGPAGLKNNVAILLKVLNTPEPWFDLINSTTEYVEGIKNGDSVIIMGGIVQVFYGDHTIEDCGYRFSYNGKTIFYSGDTTYSQNIVKGAKGVDCLIHEMTYVDEDKKIAKFWHHSTYSDAMKVFNESEAKCFVPVHLSAKTEKTAQSLSKETNIIYPHGIIKL